ncbi:MAG: DNA-directed RNA polymerase subunit A' [Candidatus Marsarchaeota archaeon]|jgi:DNA-directed RNA polymerase subunit A'|nr:DNA-directed RNA polymerase subunit A' [Candidatus Marsarchaeota archaeon]
MQAEIIDNIRFTTLSPEAIKRMSVAKLIVPDTYNEDGYPIDGGLVDQRLGVIDPGLKCKTCGGRAKTCMGHFGHIELVRPIIHPEFTKIIYLLLQSTCEKCHRILLDENQMAVAKDAIETFVTSDDMDVDRVAETNGKLAALTKKLKSVKKCPSCGAPQQKLKFERPTFFYLNGNKLKPDEIKDWLSNISNDDLKLLGIDYKATRPEWFILTSLLVPPINVRPSITLETGERSEDDLTHKLVEIMRINQRLEQDIDAGAPQIIIDDLWELLQYHVTTYFNNETPGVPVARHRSTRPLKTLAQRLKGKEGRLRYNLSGKRVNFSARTVISSDSSLTVNQVGVPMRIAENMTVPLYVTKWNIEKAKVYVSNTSYPKSINIITREGSRKRVNDTNQEDLLKEIVPGYIIERQLVDNDIVLFNRQPTLHRLSIMAHRVKVLPGKTLRLHVSAAFPYNADFDGDEMNLHVPQTLESQAEARYLMQPKYQVLSPRNGNPLLYIEEDEIAGMYLLTKDNSYYTKEETMSMLANLGIYEMPKAEKNGMYSGKSIFSMTLPNGLNFESKNKHGKVVIKNGLLVEGIIDNKLVGEKGGVLISHIFIEYGPDFNEKFLLNIAKLSLRAAYIYGLTVSVKDYYLSSKIISERANIIKSYEAKALELINSYKAGKLESLPGYTKKSTLEVLLYATLGQARDTAVQYLNKELNQSNNAYLLASIGARGNILNMVQMSMFLGQQSVRGKRPTRGYNGRMLPYFKRNTKDPKSKGFVTSNFFEGLTPTDMYQHAMGSRDSQMTKSLVTAVSGYMYRRLINAMMDFYVDSDLSVKDANGELIQTLYGGDGIDPTLEVIAHQKE